MEFNNDSSSFGRFVKRYIQLSKMAKQDVKFSEFVNTVSNLKIILWLVGGTIFLTLSVYGSAQLALHNANKQTQQNSVQIQDISEKLDRYTLIVQSNMRSEAIKDSIHNENYLQLYAEVKEIKQNVNILREAAKVNPPLYASITYLTQLVEQTTDFEKKK
jgi:hypothetical protein